MNIDEPDHRALASWAADCADRVLARFEEQHPEDLRPRHAIDAGRSWVRGEATVSEARAAAFAAHAAARDAASESAIAAARAAGHAAATAHVATHARHAAAYAATAARASAGTAPSPADATAAQAEKGWQFQHLPRHLRAVVFREGEEPGLEDLEPYDSGPHDSGTDKY